MSINNTPTASKTRHVKAAAVAIAIIGSSLVGLATATPATAMSNETQYICELAGGVHSSMDSGAGWDWEICTFSDGSSIVV